MTGLRCRERQDVRDDGPRLVVLQLAIRTSTLWYM